MQLCGRAESFLKGSDKDGLELLSLIRWSMRCSRTPARAKMIEKCEKILAEVVAADTSPAHEDDDNAAAKEKKLTALKDVNAALRWYALPEDPADLPFEAPAHENKDSSAVRRHTYQTIPNGWITRKEFTLLDAPFTLCLEVMFVLSFLWLVVFVCTTCLKKRHQTLKHVYEEIQSKTISTQGIMMGHVQKLSQV